MRKHVRIEYTIKPEIDLATYKAEVGKFVDGMHADDASHQYAVYQHEENERRFTHVGSFEAALVPAMQQQPFFQHFTGYLRQAAIGGPDVQRVGPVASTEVSRA
jgi:quinol monooxygenase YgiN